MHARASRFSIKFMRVDDVCSKPFPVVVIVVVPPRTQKYLILFYSYASIGNGIVYYSLKYLYYRTGATYYSVVHLSKRILFGGGRVGVHSLTHVQNICAHFTFQKKKRKAFSVP